ncbi:hypothetical protein G7Y89_g12859 [Cudoniella acicularis]|uniref:Uncharacterized protein n=1 Tax=Cudoniella acicularis TaxID=354080 RepID=A0A8H4R8E9_9HELO|nr:hypothetical protein G7Y89_g12859 [Cudoniella acicularis]
MRNLKYRGDAQQAEQAKRRLEEMALEDERLAALQLPNVDGRRKPEKVAGKPGRKRKIIPERNDDDDPDAEVESVKRRRRRKPQEDTDEVIIEAPQRTTRRRAAAQNTTGEVGGNFRGVGTSTAKENGPAPQGQDFGGAEGVFDGAFEHDEASRLSGDEGGDWEDDDGANYEVMPFEPNPETPGPDFEINEEDFYNSDGLGPYHEDELEVDGDGLYD